MEEDEEKLVKEFDEDEQVCQQAETKYKSAGKGQ